MHTHATYLGAVLLCPQIVEQVATRHELGDNKQRRGARADADQLYKILVSQLCAWCGKCVRTGGRIKIKKNKIKTRPRSKKKKKKKKMMMMVMMMVMMIRNKTKTKT